MTVVFAIAIVALLAWAWAAFLIPVVRRAPEARSGNAWHMLAGTLFLAMAGVLLFFWADLPRERTAVVLSMAVAAGGVAIVGLLLLVSGVTSSRGRLPTEADALLDNPFLAALVVDKEEMTVIKANAAFTHLTGFEEEEVQGASFFDIIEDVDYVRHGLRKCSDGGRTLIEMANAQLRDGRSIALDIAAHHCRFRNRGAILMTIRDARRHRSSEHLEARLAAIVQSAGMAVIGSDLEGTISEWNDAAVRILGYSREEILGQPFLTIVDPSRTEAAVQIAMRVQRGEVFSGHETMARRKDGSLIAVQLDAASIRDSRDRVIGMSCLLRDITHEKEARKKLEMAQFALDNALDTIYWFNRHGRVIYANGAAEQRMGMSLEELRRLEPEQLNARFTPERFDQLWETTRKKGVLHLEFQGKNNTLLEGLGRILDYEGEEYGCLFIRDITDRKQLETRLKAHAEAMQEANAELEAANQAKSQFLANVSHELRTPLTAILGFSDLLSTDHSAVDVRETAATIRRNSQHLLELINDVLDLAKVESGQMQVTRRSVSIGALLSDLQRLLHGKAADKGLRLVMKNHGPIPQSVMTDPTRLKQILINLVGNAIKFTDQGTVAVHFRYTTGGENGRLRFEIVDTGIGIAPQRIQKVFEPFSQADESITRKYGGTGLGLSISKRLVEMLGGAIEVTSQPGVGTAFTFDIDAGPVHEGAMVEHLCDLLGDAEHVQSDARRDTALLLGAKILLVEDGPDNQRFISVILCKAGAEVVIADQGEMGVERFLEHYAAGRPFDLVLMDMQMPVMDGFTATKRLRSIGYRGPIIAITAHAMTTEYARCSAAGCDGFATKPIMKKDLLDLALAYLGRRTPAPAASSPTDGAEPETR